MGTKRVGLARVESLLEALKRDLNLVNATLTNCTITTSAAVTFSGGTTQSGQLTISSGPVRKTKFDVGAQVSLDPQSDGTAFSGVAGETNQWRFRCGNTLSVVAIGDNQTLLAPALNTGGLNVSGDQTDNDGWEMRGASSLAEGVLNKDVFMIGTSPAFYISCKFSIADVSAIDDLRLGFAQKDEAFTATTDNYTDAAWMSVISGDIKTQTIIGNAATVTTDLTAPNSGDFADGETHTLAVYVSSAGVVTYKLNGATPTGAVAYTFANALLVTPMWFHRHDSDVGGAIVWKEFEFGLQ